MLGEHNILYQSKKSPSPNKKDMMWKNKKSFISALEQGVAIEVECIAPIFNKLVLGPRHHTFSGKINLFL